jgi:hypothetical protein
MSDMISNTFVIVDVATDRVLMVKRSRTFDFSLRSAAFATHQIVSTTSFPPIADFSFSYDPVNGVRSIGQPDDALLPNLNLNRRKIEILLLVLANVHVVRKNILTSFQTSVIRSTPIGRENFFLYWRLMTEERKLLLRKTRRFFELFQKDIEDARDCDAVNQAYRDLTMNTNVGAYSPLFSEWKASHDQGN